MIEKEFEDYLDAEYPSVVNQFTKKSPLPPIVTLAIILSFVYTLHIIICGGCGEYERLSSDWATLLGVFGGFCLFSIYIYLEKKVKNYSIVLGKLTGLEQKEYQDSYERFIALTFRSKQMKIFCVVFTIIIDSIALKMGLWYNSLLANSWLLFEIIVITIGSVLCCWLLICTSWMIYTIGKNPLKINFFHHDGVGGLKPFGQLSFLFFKLAMFITTLLALILICAPWKNSTIYYGGSMSIVVYSIVFSSFFIPLFGVHKTLKNFKKEKLDAINGILMMYNDKIIKNVDNTSDCTNIKNKLESALFVRDFVSKMGTWPFGYITFVEVGGSSVIGSAIFTFASTLTKFLSFF